MPIQPGHTGHTQGKGQRGGGGEEGGRHEGDEGRRRQRVDQAWVARVPAACETRASTCKGLASPERARKADTSDSLKAFSLLCLDLRWIG